MRPGIAAILFFLLFNIAALGKAGNGCAIKSVTAPQDTTKKDKLKKTNACNTIGNLTGNTCIGSTLTASATDPIASVEWIYENTSTVAKQQAQNTPYAFRADIAGTYFVKIITQAGCELNSNSITITNLKVPIIEISTRSNIICAEYPNPSFTGVPTFNGNHATYQWKVNEINDGPLVTDVNQPFMPAGLKKGDVVSCEMTSTDVCITTPVVQSNHITIDDIPVENPSVSIERSAANPCAGSTLVFTAIPVNGGDLPDYQWYVNLVAAPNGNAKIFISGRLNEGDEVTCSMVSNAKVCQVTTSATSMPYIVRLIPLVTPKISVSPVTFEAGVSVTYKATVENAGPGPVYQWQINSINAGSGSDTFVATKLVPGDVIKCILTSNADCTTSDMVTSDPVVNNATIPFKAATANLFTPNGDGVNDTWSFPGVDAFRNAKVRVYNRYGQQVFHSAGSVEEWDGKTDAGKQCPSGVYYYFINLNQTQTTVGSVTIIR
ncbi:gliding motility-associated C-terminal domain-containing protein [Mucilaginibacter gilvus]|uniref:Gliding motility-associated C-terminal domain-containing protein n=1 Tax=Mucilaginibacter gilvus TaxID=2305909 RepID=A0A444MPE0_9SPHI|nr:gliding motility-associated C-terminal domain-containing protein [Mucilaginibacter gilvus]RWY52499.1 gliding motility-associated C-terminal domain-containing protein [Mucilaginibacter gilvus]